MALQADCPRNRFVAAEACAVDLVLRCGDPLRPGDRLEVQFPNSWYVVNGPSFTRELQTEDPSRDHHISVIAPEGSAFDIRITPRHLNYPGGAVRHGRLITAVLREGTVPSDRPVGIRYARTRAPCIAGTEPVWIRVKGEPPVRAPELTVAGGEAKATRLIVPSAAEPGATFEARIVTLDEFDNVSRSRFESESLTLPDGTVLAAGLSFTGMIRVPVRLETEGIFRFRWRDAISNAIVVRTGKRGPYWGDLHIHTGLSQDGQGPDPYRYAREVSGLDLAAVTDHWDALGPEGYRILEAWAEEAHEPGRFVTMLGDERSPRELTGHHNVYFRDLETMRRYRAIGSEGDPGPANRFDRLADADPARVMIVPHHTGISFGDRKAGGIGCAVDWDARDAGDLRPIAEIYSHHGQSEAYAPQHLLAYEVNRMRNPERRANTSVPGPYYVQDHWRRGRRIGVIGSSDEHSGQGGRRHGGLAAIRSGELTRPALFDALRDRRCYATTGERILVEFEVDGLEMGACGIRAAGSPLPIRLRIWGTSPLLRAEILRHRFGADEGFVPVLSVSPRPESADADLSLEDRVEHSCLYYARVVQEPLEWPGMAWTSPVWVDVPRN